MNSQKNPSPPQTQTLCKDCNTFFSSPIFNGLCSCCFQNYQSELTQEPQPKQDSRVKTRICKVQFIRQSQGKEQVLDNKSQLLQKDRNNCFTCNKKLGLLGMECKCCFVYCNSHRLPQAHSCPFDHNKEAKKKLDSQLIKVNSLKVPFI